MTSSGTIGQTVIDVATIVDHAFRRAGASPADQTPDSIAAAKQNLYFFLSSLANTGVNLWTIEKKVLGTIQGAAHYACGTGTIDLKQVLRRTVSNASGGTATSSAGGVVENCFDQDITTVCTQTSINGNISYAWVNAQTITNVGIMPNGDQTYTLVWEISDDGVTWMEIYSLPQADYADRTWTYADIDTPIAAKFFRIRETGGGTLNVRALVFGQVTLETVAARTNIDQYTSLTQKTIQSNSLPQYWFNRQIDPEIVVWPTPNNFFDQIVLWRTRQIQDVGTLSNTVEIPQRWIEAVVTATARRLLLELPRVDTGRYNILKMEEDAAVLLAQEEERDRSPIFIAPDLSVYTR